MAEQSSLGKSRENQTAREHRVRSLINMVSEQRERSGEFRFRQPADRMTGVVYDDLLVLLLGLLDWTSKRSLGRKAIAARLIFNLNKQGPIGGRGRWTADNLARWLRFERETACPDTDARRIIEGLAKHVQDKVATSGDSNELLEIVRKNLDSEASNSIETVARAMVDAVPVKYVPEWSPTFGFAPLIDASLAVAPSTFDPKRLKELVKEVHDHLRAADGPRVAIIRGMPYSGKKDLLRQLLARCPGSYLRLDREDEIAPPILALALDDHNSRSFIESVYRFFAAARYRSQDVERRVQELDETAMLSRIVAMAKDVPACVLFADIAAIEQDEIMRSLAGSYAADVIAALLNGHRFTRIAFTTSMSSELGDAALEATLKCRYARTFRVSGSIPLSDLCAELKLAIPQQGPETEVDGLAAKLAKIALNFRGRLCAKEQLRLDQSCHLALSRDGGAALIRILCRKILKPNEFLVAGLIASSHDVIRDSTLKRLLKSLAEIDPRTWSSALQEDLRMLLQELVEKGFIHRLTISDRSPDKLPHTRNTGVFAIDDGWRRLLLRYWCELEPNRARMVHLLIAREAAAQSRRLRELAQSSFGRDVQVLHTLIASINPEAIEPRSNPRPFADNDDFGSLEYTENIVLPPLDRRVAYPPDRLVLRYAYFQLYARDLDGMDFGLLSRKQDAATRLGILLRLFVPESPWLQLDERVLPASLRSCTHILNAFSADEVIRLLLDTAMSAIRLQRYDVVASAVRLGEALYKRLGGTGISRVAYMRLLRTEVEVGLLQGGNPDDILPISRSHTDYQGTASIIDIRLLDVVARINSLLAGPFAASGETMSDDEILARGKLHVRQGETLHMCGRFHEARNHFKEAILLERRLAQLTRGTSQAPVLGGRGARSYLRHLLDRIRLTSLRGRFPTFIFVDNLPLPTPPLALNSLELRQASDIHAINLRRSSSGRIVDAIGAKIDAAQLAVLKHDFASAYRAVDSVLSDRFLSGSSLELLLELMAVRTRHLLDGTVLCLQQNAKAPIFESTKQVADIAAYFDLLKDTRSLDIAYLLLQKANESLASFRKLLTSSTGPTLPFDIYQRYLDVFSQTLETRFCNEDKVEAQLRKALAALDEVIRLMKQCDYGVHLYEASRFRAGLEGAAKHYSIKPREAGSN